jgi:hypothetical protein
MVDPPVTAILAGAGRAGARPYRSSAGLNPLAGEGEETPVAALGKLPRSPRLSLTQVPDSREPRMERRGQ